MFLYTDDATVRPAAAMANQHSKDANQSVFRSRFAGVAMEKQGVPAGAKTFDLADYQSDLLVATGGVYEYDCPSQQWTPGQLVGVSADSDGCKSQAVDCVSNTTAPVSCAIGQAVLGGPGLSNPETRVFVEIDTTIYGHGLQAAVAVTS